MSFSVRQIAVENPGPSDLLITFSYFSSLILGLDRGNM